MDKVVYFDYCALCLNFILLYSAIFRKMTRGRKNKYYFILLLCSMLSVLADIWAVNLENLGAGNIVLKYIVHSCYLFFHNLTPVCYIVYIIGQTDTWHKLKQGKLLQACLFLPIIIATIMLVLNPFNRAVFYLNENDVYTRGEWFQVLYVIACMYMAFGVIYILWYRKLFTKARFFSLIVLFPMLAFSAGLQYLIPELLVEMFAKTIALLFIAMMIQRPEEIIDSDTGLGKMSAYITDIKRDFINEKPIHIIMINLANYDILKEMLGYETLSELLRSIAARLWKVNKEQGTEAELYYLENGKFRLVIEEKYFDKTRKAAALLNDVFKRNFLFNQMEVNLRTCICITRCPEDIQDVDSLLAFGDDIKLKTYTGEVMFAADIYKKEYYDIVRDMDRIIEQALANHKFMVYYQPIFSVKENRFNSAEALLRLKDDKYGFISPEIFIPAAEKSGAIHQIGSFVLEEVCKFIASEEYKELNIDYIEVNLSVVQCMQKNLVNQVLELLEKYQVSPEQINLEITETAASYSQKTMMENLDLLDEAGIKISLDDFGTGYSNMRRVAELPLHIVKLDKSFTDIESDERMQIVLAHTIEMIKAMNMKIVVEGIETEGMAKIFSEMQCEYIQGYFYSRPIPRDEFVTFIQKAKE